MEAGCACLCRCRGEADFHAVVGGDGDAHTVRFADFDGDGACGGEIGVGGLDGHIHGHGIVGLILQHDGQFKAIPEVEEARGRRAHHQRQPRRDVRFRRAKVLAVAHSHHHDAVAGEVVGHGDFDGGVAVGVGAHFGGEKGQRIEVTAHTDRFSLSPFGGGRFGFGDHVEGH